jgi:hypothetical protein
MEPLIDRRDKSSHQKHDGREWITRKRIPDSLVCRFSVKKRETASSQILVIQRKGVGKK